MWGFFPSLSHSLGYESIIVPFECFFPNLLSTFPSFYILINMEDLVAKDSDWDQSTWSIKISGKCLSNYNPRYIILEFWDDRTHYSSGSGRLVPPLLQIHLGWLLVFNSDIKINSDIIMTVLKSSMFGKIRTKCRYGR